MQEAMGKFQRDVGLKETGEIQSETKKILIDTAESLWPVCGKIEMQHIRNIEIICLEDSIEK